MSEESQSNDRFAVLEGGVIAGLAAHTSEEVLSALADRLEAAGHVAPSFREAVLAREAKYPTGLPTRVPAAIPHTDPEHVLHPGLAIATLTDPVAFGEMGAPDGTTVSVQLVVMLVLKEAKSQIDALQHLVGRLQDAEAVENLLAVQGDEALRVAATTWLSGH